MIQIDMTDPMGTETNMAGFSPLGNHNASAALWDVTKWCDRSNTFQGTYQAWWRLRSHWFSEEFAKHIDELQQTAKPPRMYREPNADQ
jgi:hypothetical protein